MASITYKGQQIALPSRWLETADLQGLGATVSPARQALRRGQGQAQHGQTLLQGQGREH